MRDPSWAVLEQGSAFVGLRPNGTPAACAPITALAAMAARIVAYSHVIAGIRCSGTARYNLHATYVDHLVCGLQLASASLILPTVHASLSFLPLCGCTLVPLLDGPSSCSQNASVLGSILFPSISFHTTLSNRPSSAKIIIPQLPSSRHEGCSRHIVGFGP